MVHTSTTHPFGRDADPEAPQKSTGYKCELNWVIADQTRPKASVLSVIGENGRATRRHERRDVWRRLSDWLRRDPRYPSEEEAKSTQRGKPRGNAPKETGELHRRRLTVK
jgi:hypothetical protein